MISPPIAERRRYSIPEYEAIRNADADGDRLPLDGNHQDLPAGAVAFLGVEGEKRMYRS